MRTDENAGRGLAARPLGRHRGREALAWQNTAYNQPPHPSYFIGDGMSAAPGAAPDSLNRENR